MRSSFFMKPQRRSIVLMLLWLAFGLLMVWLPYPPLWWITTCMVILALVLDGLKVLRQTPLTIARQCPSNLAVNHWTPVQLLLSNQGGLTLRCIVIDHMPQNFLTQDALIETEIPAQSKRVVQYKLQACERGDAEFTQTELWVTSPWQLWQRRIYLPSPQAVKIYPNFAEVAHYVLLAQSNQLSQLGIHQQRRRGEGNDFLQLREFRAGDSLRQVDWKATSRQGKLISREYQDERDQQIIFLLDCGRRMRHIENGQAHLNQALNAMLLLSHVALKQGDSVGFLTFSGETRWFAPRKGMHTITPMLNAVYDLQSTTEAADYVGVAQSILQYQKRRAMIVLLTNSRNEDNEALTQACQLLGKRHLLILADLQEASISTFKQKPVQDFDQAVLYQAILDYTQIRAQTHQRLRAQKINCIDTTAEFLPVNLVNNYLKLKRSGRI